jgi:hypothetical protein
VIANHVGTACTDNLVIVVVLNLRACSFSYLLSEFF